jgi:hypothetical protein
MRTREIPLEEWPEFLREFGRRHEDWLATVRVLGPRLGDQVEARELPLTGIVGDAESGSISIHLGRPSETTLEHPIERPLRVWVELEDNGAERALEIESANGDKTILEFRVTHPPEMVDGMLEWPTAT